MEDTALDRLDLTADRFLWSARSKLAGEEK